MTRGRSRRRQDDAGVYIDLAGERFRDEAELLEQRACAKRDHELPVRASGAGAASLPAPRE